VCPSVERPPELPEGLVQGLQNTGRSAGAENRGDLNMKKSMIAIAAALLGAPAFAQEGTAYSAPPAADGALEITLGAGYTQGFGDIGSGQPSLRNLTSAGGEIQLGIGYRINPNFLVGVYGSGGKQSNGIFSGGSNIHTATAGLQANYHFLPWDTWDPWVGLGAGWRALWIDRPVVGTESRHGLDVARVTVGVDYRISPQLAISPYAGAAVTMFLTQELAGERVFSNVRSPNVNVWPMVGVVGRFDVFGGASPASAK
jgi:hypothetical protein